MTKKHFRTVINFTSIRIYFNGALFVLMKRDEFIGVTSWIAGGDKYCVQFVLKHSEILVELDTRDKFLEFLNEVDVSLGKE